MTTEDLLKAFIDEGVRCYKKNYKNTTLFNALNRHQTVYYDGQEINYWRELSVYMTAKWIKGILPEANLEVNLEGNDSNIALELSEEEQRKLNSRLFVVLRNSEVV